MRALRPSAIHASNLLQPVNAARARTLAIHTSTPTRAMSTNPQHTTPPLRLGYIPEHFSTPLHFAAQHHDLPCTLHPVPTGTGTLTARLKLPRADPNALDFAVGLTEGFVADIGRAKQQNQTTGYGIVGTYVQSALRWGISVGRGKTASGAVGGSGVAGLKGRRVGVSRIGSGSYVMAYLLALQRGWLVSAEHAGFEAFEVVEVGDFAALREAVNEGGTADFFMWEHFTTKHWWDEGVLERVGEITPPWPGWVLVARDEVAREAGEVNRCVGQGLRHYRENEGEAVRFITETMQYSEEDTREWMRGVEFAEKMERLNQEDRLKLEKTIGVLVEAGVLERGAVTVKDLVASR